MNNFKDKKILVFGLGLNQGGVGSAKFFVKSGAKVRVTDLKTAEVLKPSLDELKDFPEIKYTLGEHKKEDIDWADLIIKNPAVKPGDTYIEYAKSQGKHIETDMGIFLQFVKPSQIVGVTGTKGKSTTASLIYEVLKATSKNVILAGNIGTSVLETIPQLKPDTLVVLEISSFQLEAFDKNKISPKWAVITNISPDHLNYYQTMEEYIEAKRTICKHQTEDDFLFIRNDDKITDKSKFLKGFKGQITRFSINDLSSSFQTKLLGKHNLENMAAVLAVSRVFKLNEKTTLNTLSQFKGVPFRMELIKTWQGFKIYNDTTATNPTATIEALKTFGPRKDEAPNIILICGGMNKNMDYKELAETIDWYAKAIYFLEGDATDQIICNMQEIPFIEGRFNNLEDLIKNLKKDLKIRSFYFKKGDIILFSPGATSFNLFQNEFDRGRKFNKVVEKVFR